MLWKNQTPWLTAAVAFWPNADPNNDHSQGMIGPGRTPIWKRGSVASEPDYDWRNMPAFLIDTATRDGMSGSPVVARHSGILLTGANDGMGPDSLIGTMTKFTGIYSGRIGEDEMGVQLGLVWKPIVLDDEARTPLARTHFGNVQSLLCRPLDYADHWLRTGSGGGDRCLGVGIITVPPEMREACHSVENDRE